MQSEEVKRFGAHKNAFGFLRLLFASLVIVSHTTEIIDGDRHREILTRDFGTLSFGEVAVDCFFLVSGYLIVGSYLKNPAPIRYLRNRIARIFPGFIVASAICVFVFAPLSGAQIQATDVVKFLVRSLALQPPYVPNAFAGTHFASLNVSMWTLAYEFRCYLLVLALGSAGILSQPRLMVSLAMAAMVVQCFGLSSQEAALTSKLPYSD